jgi:hypothetical protein
MNFQKEFAPRCREQRRKRGLQPCKICTRRACKEWWKANHRPQGEARTVRFFTALEPSVARKFDAKRGKEFPADFLRGLVYKELGIQGDKA